MLGAFAGPSLLALPLRAGIGFLEGCLYGSLFNTHRGWTGLAFVIREVADPILYYAVNFMGDEGRKSASLYAMTNLATNVATLILLNRWGLIGRVGSAVFSAMMGLEMLSKWTDFSKYRVRTLAHPTPAIV